MTAGLAYAAACVVVPVVWGVIVAWLSNRLDRRVVRREHETAPPDLRAGPMYHI